MEVKKMSGKKSAKPKTIQKLLHQMPQFSSVRTPL